MAAIEDILLNEANKSQMSKKYACAIFNRKNEIIALGHNDYIYPNTGENTSYLLRT
jgi:hypothetical protein